MRIMREVFSALLVTVFLLAGCVPFASNGDVVRVMEVKEGFFSGFKAEDRTAITNLRKLSRQPSNINPFYSEHEETQSYSAEEYLQAYPSLRGKGSLDYKVGSYDVLSVTVYDEGDLSREAVRVSGDGNITFPLIGRLKVEGLVSSQIEDLIAGKLAEGQYLLDAQVTVMVEHYESKKYSVLGAVKNPGTFPYKAKERLLDAISYAGGVNFETAGEKVMIIRTNGVPGNRLQGLDERKPADYNEQAKDDSSDRNLEFLDSDSDSREKFVDDSTSREEKPRQGKWTEEMSVASIIFEPHPQKIVINIDLKKLLEGNDQISNLPLLDEDLVYIPKAEFFYILGEVNSPGSYRFTKKDMTLVESISTAGGFTSIANRKKTRIIRVEDGVEKVIIVNVDAITSAGRKIQDVLMEPGDIIVVPESFF